MSACMVGRFRCTRRMDFSAETEGPDQAGEIHLASPSF